MSDSAGPIQPSPLISHPSLFSENSLFVSQASLLISHTSTRDISAEDNRRLRAVYPDKQCILTQDIGGSQWCHIIPRTLPSQEILVRKTAYGPKVY